MHFCFLRHISCGSLWGSRTPAIPFLSSWMQFATDVTSVVKWSYVHYTLDILCYICRIGTCIFQEVPDLVAGCCQTFHCSCPNMKQMCPYCTKPWIGGLWYACCAHSMQNRTPCCGTDFPAQWRKFLHNCTCPNCHTFLGRYRTPQPLQDVTSFCQ